MAFVRFITQLALFGLGQDTLVRAALVGRQLQTEMEGELASPDEGPPSPEYEYANASSGNYSDYAEATTDYEMEKP